MKKILLLLVGVACLGLRSAHAQGTNVPRIEWQRSYGGALNDLAYSIAQTTDGGFILGGRSTSNPGGNKTAAHYGDYDYWVLRLDSAGNVIWDGSFGGVKWDELYTVAQTPDGGFLVAGSSDSIANGNKSSASFGFRDGWVVKLNASGDKLWDHAYGGALADIIWTMHVTADGGAILGGYSQSVPGGNKESPNWGGDDFWIIRLDAAGNKLWDRSYGGVQDDRLYAVKETADGGFILGGTSGSPTNQIKTATGFGSADFWIVRTDAAGNKLWDRCFGGTSADELYGLTQTADGGFFMGGYSQSGAGGSKTGPVYGGYDLWVVRTDAGGNKLWDQTLGGSGNEGFLGTFGIEQTFEGGFIFGSTSQGSDRSGTKSSFDRGGGDWWVIRLNSAGTKLWDETFGAPFFDALYSLHQTRDGGFIMTGSSYSDVGGNKTVSSHGGADYWVVKLAANVPKLQLLPQSTNSMQSHDFHFRLLGESGQRYLTECSQDFQNWSVIQTNQLSGNEVEITVPMPIGGGRRFYRVRLFP